VVGKFVFACGKQAITPASLFFFASPVSGQPPSGMPTVVIAMGGAKCTVVVVWEIVKVLLLKNDQVFLQLCIIA